MKKDKKNNTELFIDDNETEQDLLLMLANIPAEQIEEINKKYENSSSNN